MLLAWPFYSYLVRKGQNEFMEIRNHQMHIGLAGIAVATTKELDACQAQNETKTKRMQ
jgi:hypothetical protein